MGVVSKIKEAVASVGRAIVGPDPERNRLREVLAYVESGEWKRDRNANDAEREKVKARVDAGELTDMALKPFAQRTEALNQAKQAASAAVLALKSGAPNAMMREYRDTFVRPHREAGAKAQRINMVEIPEQEYLLMHANIALESAQERVRIAANRDPITQKQVADELRSAQRAVENAQYDLDRLKTLLIKKRDEADRLEAECKAFERKMIEWG